MASPGHWTSGSLARWDNHAYRDFEELDDVERAKCHLKDVLLYRMVMIYKWWLDMAEMLN